MKIIEGKIEKAQKIIIYGPEGIGKSTFASQFPDPIFIDTEGSTTHLDVRRFEEPSSWPLLIAQVDYVLKNPDICKTLVIDTADWAEILVTKQILAEDGMKSLGDYSWGNGYVKLKERFGQLLNLLSDVVEKGIHVVVTAHAKIEKFEQPADKGAFDRWSLKLSKQVSAITKEWADMILFANFVPETYYDSKTKQTKTTGKEKRVMFTHHTAAWDAKNRHHLDEMLPLCYEAIEKAIAFNPDSIPDTKNYETPSTENSDEATQDPDLIIDPGETAKYTIIKNVEKNNISTEYKELPENYNQGLEALPKDLADLMRHFDVSINEFLTAIGPTGKGGLGYFPAETGIENIPDAFFDHVLAKWNDEIYPKIEENRSLPFEL